MAAAESGLLTFILLFRTAPGVVLPRFRGGGGKCIAGVEVGFNLLVWGSLSWGTIEGGLSEFRLDWEAVFGSIASNKSNGLALRNYPRSLVTIDTIVPYIPFG